MTEMETLKRKVNREMLFYRSLSKAIDMDENKKQWAKAAGVSHGLLVVWKWMDDDEKEFDETKLLSDIHSTANEIREGDYPVPSEDPVIEEYDSLGLLYGFVRGYELIRGDESTAEEYSATAYQ